MTREAVRQIVLDGFFPLTAADERPRTRQTGLREIGLPYAADTAVSRHLAAFVDGRHIDAVLFAGGSLQPPFLQERLLALIARWQGQPPVLLSLQDMSLGIALGAAHFGAVLTFARERIRGGYARSVYLELHQEQAGKAPDLVCVLPQGFEEGGRLTLASPAFTLLVNRPVRFTAYTSNRRQQDQAGAIVPLGEGGFHPLPPLHTALALDDDAFNPRKAAQQSITVQLEAELTELGVLQLALVNEERQKRWRLDFNLRKPLVAGESTAENKSEDIGVAPQALKAATERIALFYGKKQSLNEKDNPKQLVKDLERIFSLDRSRWGVPLLRTLWPELYPGITRRNRSLAHENTWLYLAGFALRPGYGSELDPWRMMQLWECYELGIVHKKEKSAQANWWMMWRRTAGGLPAEQQEQLLRDALPQLRKAPAEFVEGTRLLGTLERIPVEQQTGNRRPSVQPGAQGQGDKPAACLLDACAPVEPHTALYGLGCRHPRRLRGRLVRQDRAAGLEETQAAAAERGILRGMPRHRYPRSRRSRCGAQPCHRQAQADGCWRRAGPGRGGILRSVGDRPQLSVRRRTARRLEVGSTVNGLAAIGAAPQ